MKSKSNCDDDLENSEINVLKGELEIPRESVEKIT